MKQEEWNAGLNHLDPDLIEKHIAQKEKLQKNAKGLWLRFGAIAACFALIVGAVLLAPTQDPGRNVPIWNDAHYTAEEIAALVNSKLYDSASTNAYKEYYVPDAQFLCIDPLPTEAHLGIYRYNKKGADLNREEFQEFINGFLPALAVSINASVPKYEIKENWLDESNYAVNTDIGFYNMLIQQDDTLSYFNLSNHYGTGKIILDGEIIQIDQRLSDADIIKSVESIKESLFQIFGVSFTNTKVIRDYGSYSKHGAEFIDIYFYDEAEHLLNMTQAIPISDYISIHFDNFENYSEDVVSDGVLTQASIRYLKNRSDITKKFELSAKEKRISLEEAETLLYKGYVFGGHSCPLCMSAQNKVSFEGYDFVEIEYIFGHEPQSSTPTVGIPFYAFYKQIGIAQNGNLKYAKTYVPAIPVMGLEEYFESQTQNHRKPIFPDGYVIG